MLKLFPIAGTILLTVIILYVVFRVMRNEKQKIADALALRLRSTCCNAPITPFRWTQDGWVSTCDECHAFQYLGDDYDNPPAGFDISGYPNAAPAPRPAASEPESHTPLSRDSGSSCTCDTLRYINDDHEEGCPRHPLSAPHFYESNPGSPLEVTSVDDGEPLPAAMAHQPNVGGEGNPAYEGPHYAVPHDRFVPYDMLGEPIPGTAVHLVGNTGIMGPLPEIDGDDNIREWNPDDE